MKKNASKPKVSKEEKQNQIESFFEKHKIKILVVSLVTATLFSILLFDIKTSTGEDDAWYLLAARKFLDGVSFPSWHGSLYPIFISFFLKIFGFKLMLFKLLSFVMIIAHLYVFYFAFRTKVPWANLMMTLLFTSVCIEILYFSSQTYSEAFYLLLQIGTFAAFYKIYDTEKNTSDKIFINWKQWLFFGLMMFLLTQTRNVGWAIIIAASIYYLSEKKFRQILASWGSFLVFYLPYSLYKFIFWSSGGIGVEGQFEKMFWINPYNKSAGFETFHGFIIRFIENSKLYLSKHFFIILGWKSSSETSLFVTILVYFTFLFALVIIYKKRRELLFPTLYIIIALLVTFISQQTMWDQNRLILIFIPIIVLLLLTALSDFLAKYKLPLLGIIPVFLLFLMIMPSLSKSIKATKLNSEVLKANIAGDKLYGFTPDWRHYIEMVEWSSQNIPKKEIVACRKPGIAFVYGNGRNFFGIYSIKIYQIDEVLDNLKKAESHKYHYAFEYNRKDAKFAQLYPFFNDISAIVNQQNGKQYLVFSLNKAQDEMFKPMLTNSGLPDYSIEKLNQMLSKDNKNDYAVYPDSLLNYFEKNKVDYLILASLRANPKMKTTNYINTIHRFVHFIGIKYPGIFIPVYQTGSDEDEPTSLIKIDYSKIRKE